MKVMPFFIANRILKFLAPPPPQTNNPYLMSKKWECLSFFCVRQPNMSTKYQPNFQDIKKSFNSYFIQWMIESVRGNINCIQLYYVRCSTEFCCRCYLEMYSLMLCSSTGIMGIGALVLSQYDLSFLLAQLQTSL